MDASYFSTLFASAIAVSLGSLVAFLLLGDKVTKHMNQERAYVQQELQRLGRTQEQIQELVGRIDGIATLKTNYRNTWQAFLVVALFLFLSSLSATQQPPIINPLNATGLALVVGGFAFLLGICYLWPVMKALGP